MFPLLVALGGLLAVLAGTRKATPAGPSPPPPGGGGGGGATPVQVPPSGPPGLSYPLPAPGELYRPNVYLPAVRAQAFEGRALIESWRGGETTPADAPKERHQNIMSLLDSGKLDAPTWIRVTVRPGFQVDVTGDVASYKGVRLCGPMRSAQAIADAWGAMLIAPQITDAIWRARSLPLAPQPVGWTNPNGSWTNPGGGVPWLLYYADRVAAEIQKQGLAAYAERGPSAIVPPLTLSTLSKDYVLTPGLLVNPSLCAIYGLTKTDGVPFQHSDGPHYLDFFDYSHGIRVVRQACFVDGIEADLADVYRTRPDWVNHLPGMPAPPTRHPAIPPRPSSGVVV